MLHSTKFFNNFTKNTIGIMTETLAKSPLFQGITEDEIKNLLSSFPYQVKTFHPGNLVASRNETCAFLIIILEGSVKGEMLDFSGKTIKIEDLEAPRAIAPAFLFGKENQFPVDVIATSEIRLLYLPKQTLIQYIQRNERFLNNYLNAIANRAQFLTKKLYFLSFSTIKEKLANYILELSKPYKTEVELPVSQQELAELFGVARPSLARCLNDLEKNRCIEVSRKKVIILDRQGLEKILKQ